MNLPDNNAALDNIFIWIDGSKKGEKSFKSKKNYFNSNLHTPKINRRFVSSLFFALFSTKI